MKQKLEEWFARVRGLDRNAYAAGKVLDLSAPTELHQWSGPEQRISKLYVRKEFSSLYVSILSVAARGVWLVHLNGNPGVGKSAFLWYFIIRYVNEKGSAFRSILYQSGDFIWEFHSSGRVQVERKFLFPTESIAKVQWHLVNQKVGAESLGQRVLVAASPHPSNVKPATPNRMLAVRFMYPWDKDEFDALVDIWKAESFRLVEKAKEMEAAVAAFEAYRCQQAVQAEYADETVQAEYADEMELDEAEEVPVDVYMQEEIKNENEFEELPNKSASMSFEEKVSAAERVGIMASTLRKEAASINVRVRAADTFFSWFGGAPRKLWQLEEKELTDVEMERLADTALLSTDLVKVYRIMQSGANSDDVSWALIQFKRPTLPNARYIMEFASAKIKYKFVSVLGKSKAEDLKTLLYSADPEYAALRGFIFEQEVVKKVLHADVMVDTKHCAKCNARDDDQEGPVKWIACDVCDQWYHQSCMNIELPVILYKWQCQPCPGKPGKQVLSTAIHRRLKYYEGDLKTALLEAGSDAFNYVFRPLRKTNAAFDFAIPPYTLGQATAAAHRHTESYEAVKEGLGALQAWNEVHSPGNLPETYLLVFFLMRTNYPDFGFQSYRNSRGAVAKNGVKGIVQAKVLVSVYGEKQAEQRVDISQPPLVENLDDLSFTEIDYKGMKMEELKDLARTTGFRGYSGLKRSALINRLRTWIESRTMEFESRDFEKKYFIESESS